MTYLVDANVLSEPTRPNPEPRVLEWLRAHEHELVVNPVVLGELRFGILLLAPGRRRRALERWFNKGIEHIECLSWDRATGLRWARLLADLRHAGESMPIKDSLIAASALTHRLKVATRNARDFAKAGVRVVDPWS